MISHQFFHKKIDTESTLSKFSSFWTYDIPNNTPKCLISIANETDFKAIDEKEADFLKTRIGKPVWNFRKMPILLKFRQINFTKILLNVRIPPRKITFRPINFKIRKSDIKKNPIKIRLQKQNIRFRNSNFRTKLINFTSKRSFFQKVQGRFQSSSGVDFKLPPKTFHFQIICKAGFYLVRCVQIEW